MESAEAVPVPVATVEPVQPKPDETIHRSLLHPELRLSRRQKQVLGLVGIKEPVTEKQAQRNKVAGERLKSFHAARKKLKAEGEAEKQRQFESGARVRVAAQKQRDPAGRVRIKRPAPPIEYESSSSDEEIRRKAKKVSKTAKALEKLDDTISRVAKVVVPMNPYLDAMMRRQF